MYTKVQALKQRADSLNQLTGTVSSTGIQKTAAAMAQDSLQKAQQAIQEYVNTAEKKLQQYAKQLQQPYYDKINEVIKAVAVRRKLATVAEAGNMLYVAPGADITDEVIKQLGAKAAVNSKIN